MDVVMCDLCKTIVPKHHCGKVMSDGLEYELCRQCRNEIRICIGQLDVPETQGTAPQAPSAPHVGRTHKRTPVHCNSPAVRHEPTDAYACLVCDSWIEKQCDDANCVFCKDRPARPSLAGMSVLAKNEPDERFLGEKPVPIESLSHYFPVRMYCQRCHLYWEATAGVPVQCPHCNYRVKAENCPICFAAVATDVVVECAGCKSEFIALPKQPDAKEPTNAPAANEEAAS